MFTGNTQQLSGVAECHRLSVGTDDIGGTLSFQKDGVDLPTLTDLSSGEVQLKAKRIGASGTKSDEGE